MSGNWRPEGWKFGRGTAPGNKTLMFCERKEPLLLRALTEGEMDLFEHGADAMLEAINKKLGMMAFLLYDGVCPYCGTDLEAGAEMNEGEKLFTRHSCSGSELEKREKK